MKVRTQRWDILAIALLVVVLAFVAWALPVTQDEAYYSLWSRSLDAGYFDHPPLVAFMASTHRLALGQPWALRLGTVFTLLLSVVGTLALAKQWLTTSRRDRLAVILLVHFSLFGLLAGFLTTPDAALVACWIWAMHEAGAALQGNRYRWLSTGLFVGLGLLAKYTMVLMGPVLLWALLSKAHRSKLRTPWPYIGGLVSALVFAPHIAWNHNHQWISLRFQFAHGIGASRPQTESQKLPLATVSKPGNSSYELARPYQTLAETSAGSERRPLPYDRYLKVLNRYLGFYGSQLVLWGGLLPGLIYGLWHTVSEHRRSRPRKRKKASEKSTDWSRKERVNDLLPLHLSGLAVPLILFGVLALFTKVEANWSGMYCVSAGLLAVAYCHLRLRLLIYGAACNCVLLLLVLAHIHFGVFASRPHRDRLLLETSGYRELTDLVAVLDHPVFGDTYQVSSMLAFYGRTVPGSPIRPKRSHRINRSQLMQIARYHNKRQSDLPDVSYEQEVAKRAPLDRRDRGALLGGQWPGITRPSEFTRRQSWQPFPLESLRRMGRVSLVTTQNPPPVLGRFQATEMTQLRDCKGRGLQLITITSKNGAKGQGNPDRDIQQRCRRPIHDWYLVTYKTR